MTPLTHLFRSLACALVATMPLAIGAQNFTPRDSSRSVDRLMNADEMRATGVSSLTRAQRNALDAWLQRYTEHVIADQAMRDARTYQTAAVVPASSNTAATAPSPMVQDAKPSGEMVVRGRPPRRPPVVPGMARITSVIDGGDLVRLDDGSVWQIYTRDVVQASGWRRGDQVVVRSAPITEGDHYDVLLVNASDGSRALARIGRTNP